ncbi:MAG: thioredoxin [Planctomycetota bacterium]|nr:MAG: thioredoxin [Planctomycetota bacterium]
MTDIAVELRNVTKVYSAGPNTLEFTEAGFDNEVLQASEPVLVDFWAEWCMPCKALAPTIDELATEYAGKAKIGKLDTDANQSVAAKFGISAIPTVILFHNGQIKEKFIGLRGKQDFQTAIDALLNT